MTRLQSELHRLYLLPTDGLTHPGAQSSGMTDAGGAVRAMVMELVEPPSWEVLSAVWHGVQADLKLPAPAIAISGTDALQLWFSLAEPIPAERAHAFLLGLRELFLPDVEARRVRLLPAPDAAGQHAGSHAKQVPAEQGETGNWSAFVAPDLAPVFGDTPWLDIPPGEEGQANILRGLDVMTQTAFEAAMDKLGPIAAAPKAAHACGTSREEDGAPRQLPTAALACDDPRRFLLQVMNDVTVALALRIEAAKVLLQHSTARSD